MIQEPILKENGITRLVEEDPWRMQILREVEKLDLPDWWIGAGFVRNKVWDHIFYKETRREDVDVIYFDKTDLGEETEKQIEQKLARSITDVEWSVTNQARMHLLNGDRPYTSSLDAISMWPETATSVAVKIQDQKVKLIAPNGISDLVQGIVRPTPRFKEKRALFDERQKKKNWKSKWPGLRFMISCPKTALCYLDKES